MGMLQDTVRNLKKLADAPKVAGTPANVGVTYKVDPDRLMVTGTFTLQLNKLSSSDPDPHDFIYDVVDFVAPPPPHITVSPTTIAAATDSNVIVTYAGLVPLPSGVVVRIYPANITPASGNDRAVSSVIGLSDSATIAAVNLSAGTYQVLAYIDDGTRAFLPGLRATLTVA